MPRFFICIIILTFRNYASSQVTANNWSLERCIDSALNNNLSIKQAEIQEKLAELAASQAKLNQYPSAQFTTPLGYQFGRTINPITNNFTSLDLVYQTSTLNGSVLLIDWGQLHDLVRVGEYNYESAKLKKNKAEKDITLTITGYYLQALLAAEQLKISKVQLEQTKKQLEVTVKRFSGGTLPPLSISQMKVQLASDSISVITNQSNYENNMISLKSIINVPLNAPFDIENQEQLKELPDIENLDPENIYQIASGNQPIIKADMLNIKAAEMNVKAATHAQYPYVSLNYSLGSTFSNYTSGTPFKQWWSGYYSQLNLNSNELVNVTLNFPIFNNGHLHNAVQQSKVQLQNSHLQKDQDNVQLKQNIYTAFSNALYARQKLAESQIMVDESQKVYDYTYKGYQLGSIDALTLITAQNNLLRSKLQQLANQYDYTFKTEIIKFYFTAP